MSIEVCLGKIRLHQAVKLMKETSTTSIEIYPYCCKITKNRGQHSWTHSKRIVKTRLCLFCMKVSQLMELLQIYVQESPSTGWYSLGIKRAKRVKNICS